MSPVSGVGGRAEHETGRAPDSWAGVSRSHVSWPPLCPWRERQSSHYEPPPPLPVPTATPSHGRTTSCCLGEAVPISSGPI